MIIIRTISNILKGFRNPKCIDCKWYRDTFDGAECASPHRNNETQTPCQAEREDQKSCGKEARYFEKIILDSGIKNP